MPPKKPPACASCGQPFLASDSPVTYRSKQYHPSCLEAMKIAAKAKDATTSSKLNDPALKELEAYLLRLYSLGALTPLLEKQIRDMHGGQRPVSYEDMLLALKYFYEIENHPIDKTYPPNVGIVPHVLDEARAFREVIQQAEKANKKFTPKNETVVIKLPPSDGHVKPNYSMEDL